jgi:glutaredoxin
MAIKLHRCSLMWFKAGFHPCWRVQSALDDQDIEYVVVTGPLRRGKREAVKQLTGQTSYPTIEFEDGTAYREESADMAKKIRDGRLFEGRSEAPQAGREEVREEPGEESTPPPTA